MSLEEAIVAHTEALRENTELLKILTSKARAGTTDAKPDSAKGSDKGSEKAADKPARGRTAKVKTPTAAQMKEAVTEFLAKAGDNEDEYNERKTEVKRIIADFKATKFTEIAEEDRAEALEALETAEAEVGKGAADDDVV